MKSAQHFYDFLCGIEKSIQLYYIFITLVFFFLSLPSLKTQHANTT